MYDEQNRCASAKTQWWSINASKLVERLLDSVHEAAGRSHTQQVSKRHCWFRTLSLKLARWQSATERQTALNDAEKLVRRRRQLEILSSSVHGWRGVSQASLLMINAHVRAAAMWRVACQWKQHCRQAHLVLKAASMSAVKDCQLRVAYLEFWQAEVRQQAAVLGWQWQCTQRVRRQIMMSWGAHARRRAHTATASATVRAKLYKSDAACRYRMWRRRLAASLVVAKVSACFDTYCKRRYFELLLDHKNITQKVGSTYEIRATCAKGVFLKMYFVVAQIYGCL